jgi:hypothetical protein
MMRRFLELCLSGLAERGEDAPHADPFLVGAQIGTGGPMGNPEYAPEQVEPNGQGDRVARVMVEIFAAILEDMGKHPISQTSGEGRIDCRVCGRPGGVFFCWRRHDGRRRDRQALAFNCETDRCIRGSGH